MKNTRRERFNSLLAGPRFNGDRSAFLKASGLSKGRLTQLLDPSQPFGDTAAKNLCEKLHLPNGWFESFGVISETSPSNHAPARMDSAQAAIDLGATLAGLSSYFERMDDNTKKMAVMLIGQLADNPADHARIAAMIDLSIASKAQKVA